MRKATSKRLCYDSIYITFFEKKVLEMESRLEACTVVEHEKMEVSVVFKGRGQGILVVVELFSILTVRVDSGTHTYGKII